MDLMKVKRAFVNCLRVQLVKITFTEQSFRGQIQDLYTFTCQNFTLEISTSGRECMLQHHESSSVVIKSKVNQGSNAKPG